MEIASFLFDSPDDSYEHLIRLVETVVRQFLEVRSSPVRVRGDGGDELVFVTRGRVDATSLASEVQRRAHVSDVAVAVNDHQVHVLVPYTAQSRRELKTYLDMYRRVWILLSMGMCYYLAATLYGRMSHTPSATFSSP